MNKEQLIEVFLDTQKQTLEKYVDISTTTKHHTDEIISVPTLDKIAVPKVVNSDTVSVAHEYSKLGKTAVLNMASAKYSGGGVANGAKAQEECLFRCSNLFDTVKQSFYPLKSTEALYTRNAIFFKNFNYETIEPFSVDVITIPAFNLNPMARYDNLENNPMEFYEPIMKEKMRLMFDLAIKNGCVNIILGAFGCGVFKNNPVDVARMFEDIILEKKDTLSNSYMNCFDNIVFAIINDHNSVGNNFDVFYSFFGG